MPQTHRMTRRQALKGLSWLIAGVGMSWTHASCRQTPPVTKWSMINVCPAATQADFHLLEFPDGTRMMIDVADGWDSPGVALSYLRSRAIHAVDTVIISHFHKDHYGRLREMIESGVQVGRVVGNIPHRKVAEAESHWIDRGGCDWEDIQATLAFLRERNIPFVPARPGNFLYDKVCGGVPVRLELLVAYDGLNTPVGEVDVNDTSIVLRVTHGSVRALFTGDLNARLGGWLASSNVDLRADVLKVPHHGTEGLPPNEFFAAVGAKVALIPAPKSLWFTARSARTRNYFAEARTPVYVSGIHGHVTVTLAAEGYSVVSERGVQ